MRALHHRNFRRFVYGQSISLIGTWMQRVALGWLVYRLTDSALLLGAVNASDMPTRQSFLMQMIQDRKGILRAIASGLQSAAQRSLPEKDSQAPPDR